MQHAMHTMWYLMHLSCFVLCHEVPSIRFPSANRLISSVFDDCMLQTVSLYVIVYSVRSSTSLEQSIRTSVRGHFLPSKQTHTEHKAGLVYNSGVIRIKWFTFRLWSPWWATWTGFSRIYEKPFRSESLIISFQVFYWCLRKAFMAKYKHHLYSPVSLFWVLLFLPVSVVSYFPFHVKNLY